MKNIGINLEVVNQFNSWINDPKNPYIRQIRSILNKYGTVEEINAKARNAKLLSTRMSRLEAIGATEYIEQIMVLTDCFKVKIPHNELFMPYCFGPLYLIMGVGYLVG